MNHFSGKHHKKANGILFSSASLLSFVFAFLLLINFETEATVASNCSKSNITTYCIQSLNDYLLLYEKDNKFCSVANLSLWFYIFKNADELFKFLGLPNPNPSVTSVTEDENSSGSDSAVASSLVSTQDIKKTFSNKKSISITIFDDSFFFLHAIKRLVKKENLSQTFQKILNQFSPDLQVRIHENIKKNFPETIFVQIISKLEQNSSANDMFAKYQEKLNRLSNSDDEDCEIKMNGEYKILHSLLMTLFLEKISQEILHNLPVNLQEMHLSIPAESKPLLNIANSIGNLTKLKKIELSGAYFSYQSSDYIQILSSLPKCQNLILDVSELSHIFIKSVKQKLNEKVDKSSMQFPSLNSLSLLLHPDESFTTKDIQSIVKLPVLRSLKVVDLPDDLSYDGKLKETINKSPLLNIDLSWEILGVSTIIHSNRKNSKVPFSCEFDFRVIMQCKIIKLKSTKSLTKDKSEHLRISEEIIELKVSLQVKYILEIIYLLDVYFSRNADKNINPHSHIVHLRCMIQIVAKERITQNFYYNDARNTPYQTEEMLSVLHGEMVSAEDNLKKEICETIKKLKEITSKNVNSRSQTFSKIKSKIANFEKMYSAELADSQK